MTADNGARPVNRPRGAMVAPVPFDVLEDPVATAAAYITHIERSGLSVSTIRSYSGQTARFATWLATQANHRPGETFTDPFSRDFAVRDYRAYLLTERDLAGSSVDAALASLDSFFLWLGLGRSTTRRVKSGFGSSGFGEHLTKDQAREVMRAAERRGPRDLALVGVMMLAGLRVSEVAAINEESVSRAGDWYAEARSGMIHVKGKGGKVRAVPLGAQLRDIMLGWRRERNRIGAAADEPGLFVTSAGRRLAVRTINYTVSKVGEVAGVPTLHPHQLRHTCARQMLDAGVSLPEIQKLLGHNSLQTTQIYLKPSAEQMGVAMDSWKVDY